MMTRREILRSTAAVAMASLISNPKGVLAEAKKKPFQLNYSIASCMYGTTKLEEILPEVQRTGATSIDLWPRVHGNQREQADELGLEAFRKLLDQHQVQLGMTTRYDLGPFGLNDEVKYVHQLKGDLIVTGAKAAPGDTLKDQVRAFVEKLKPHVAHAEKHGVTIAIENHSNSLIYTPDSLRYFAEFATSPHLGIAFAPYHLPQDPALLAKLIEDLGPKLVHFYAWEHGDGCMKKLPKKQELKQLPGRGPLDFAPLIQALKAINFQGRTQVFMHPVPRGIPILESTAEVTTEINRARGYLNQYL